MGTVFRQQSLAAHSVFQVKFNFKCAVMLPLIALYPSVTLSLLIPNQLLTVTVIETTSTGWFW